MDGVARPGRTPFFSVCIPVHNDAAWLRSAVESVLAQSYGAFEIVIGDNASTDHIGELVAEFQDPRVRYRRFDHFVSVNASFNRVLAMAEGEWVHPLSADDRLRPECLAKVAAVIREHERAGHRLVLVAGDAWRVDEQGRPNDIGQHDPKQRRAIPYRKIPGGVHDARSWLLANARPGVPSWMPGALSFQREALVAGGALRPEIEMCADLELVLRIAAHGDVAYIDDFILEYTVRGGSASHRLVQADLRRGRPDTMVGRAWASAVEAHASVRGVSAEERVAMRSAMARSLLQRAIWHRTNEAGGGTVRAWRDILRSCRLSPRTALGAKGLAIASGIAVLPRPLLVKLAVLGHRYGVVVA